MAAALGVFLTTIRESIRSRVLWVLLLFGLLSLLTLPLIPAVGEEEKAKFILLWSAGASTLVASLSMIFLVAPAASREIEEKTLHQAMAKPVSRFGYFLGRALGFSSIALALMVGMGGITYATLRFSIPADSKIPMLAPVRVLEADEVEVEGPRRDSVDWDVKEWLPQGGKLVYRFHDLQEDSRALGEVKMLLKLCGSLTLTYPSFSQVAVRFKNLDTGQEWRTLERVDQEFHLQDLDPVWLRGDVQVELFPSFGGIGIGSRKFPESLGVRLRVEEPSSPFVNILGAFVSLGIGVALLSSVALFVSFFMGGKIAICLALSVLMAGHNMAYVGVLGRIIRNQVEWSGPTVHEHSDREAHSEQEKIQGPPSLFRSILAYASDGLAFVLPDLERYDLTDELLAGHNIGFRRLLSLLFYYGRGLLLCVILGGWALKSRELQ